MKTLLGCIKTAALEKGVDMWKMMEKFTADEFDVILRLLNYSTLIPNRRYLLTVISMAATNRESGKAREDLDLNLKNQNERIL